VSDRLPAGRRDPESIPDDVWNGAALGYLVENFARNLLVTAAREVGAGVHGPDAGRVGRRVEQVRVTAAGVVAAVQRGPAAPAATPGDPALLLDHEVRAVLHQRGVQPHDRAARLDLRLTQEALLQLADGRSHHLTQGRKVLEGGRAEREGV
jgi:hypothetical protein